MIGERGGRFWKRLDGSKELWTPVEYSVAMEKVKQAYRDLGSKRKSQGADGSPISKKGKSGFLQVGGDQMSAFPGHQGASLQGRAASMLNNPGSISNQLAFLNFQRAQESERQQLMLMLGAQAQQQQNISLQAAAFLASQQRQQLGNNNLMGLQLQRQLAAQQALRTGAFAGMSPQMSSHSMSMHGLLGQGRDILRSPMGERGSPQSLKSGEDGEGSRPSAGR